MKRAERALSMLEGSSSGKNSNLVGGTMEGSWTHYRLVTCFENWCDLSEKGWILVVLYLLSFVTAYVCIDSNSEKKRNVRRVLLVVGILGVVIRLSLWPIYWYFWLRKIEKVSFIILYLY